MSDTSAFKPALTDLFLGPDEWLGFVVIRIDVGIDVLLELFEAREGSAAERLPLQDREPYLDLIEPRRARRREVKLHIGMGLKPWLVLLVGVEVVEDDVKLAFRKSRGYAVHEVEKFDPATAFRMCRNDLPGGDFQRREQRGRAMPLVVVALAGKGAAKGRLPISNLLILDFATVNAGFAKGAGAASFAAGRNGSSELRECQSRYE